MEIVPVPHRATSGERRWLALGVLVLLPVVLLVLLPAVLGLDRFVVTDRSMDGSLGAGSVVLAREVPPADLEVGNVISLPVNDGSEDRVLRRIVSIEDGVAATQADSTGASQAQTLPLTAATYHRVWLGVPWIGYPFLGGWVPLALAAGVALLVSLVLALGSAQRVPSRATEPSPPRVPVG